MDQNFHGPWSNVDVQGRRKLKLHADTDNSVLERNRLNNS